MFCVTTKGSVSQTAAKKTRTSLLMCTVQERWLHSDVTSVNLSNLFGNRLTMLMSILNCSHELDYAFAPYGFSKLAGGCLSWQRSYIYSLLLYVPQKVSEHVLIGKQVGRVMLQYGSVWLYKIENSFRKWFIQFNAFVI